MRIPITRRRLRIAAPLVLTVAIAMVVVGPMTTSDAATRPTEGVACSTESSNTFSLSTQTGYISTPDGNSIFMWSYSLSGQPFQLPGPTLCVDAGTPVTVVLHNTLPEATSMVFPGQLHVRANGHVSQPQFSATGALTSMSDAAAATSGSVTYTFTAGSPGTYLYTTGSDVAKQQQMGLYGALVVRPPGHPDHANSRADSQFNPAREFLMLMSDVDPDLHLAVERGQFYDVTKTTPRYFLLNGRSMPDTLAPNFAAWLPSQPYGALVRIEPNDPNTNPQPALIRFVNAGPVGFPFHPHGSSERVINRDGQAMQSASGADASVNDFGLVVGPGQSMDALEKWSKEYDPSSNPIPSDIQLPQLQDQIVGPGQQTWFSENPYLGGTQGQLPTGIVQNNQCGEYYQVAHSHALFQATNYGASFGGMMTLIRIDPPSGCPATP